MSKFYLRILNILITLLGTFFDSTSQYNLIINGVSNISYDLDSSCNLLTSPNVPPGTRCLILCQLVDCKELSFEQSNRSCRLFQADPSLISYESLPGLDINYNLSRYLGIGEKCKFNFTCNLLIGSTCSNGYCICIRNQDKLDYGMVSEWNLNLCLKDAVQCNDLTPYSADFNPVRLFGNSTSYLQAPPGVYFTGDFTITGWVYLYSFGIWDMLLSFGNGEGNDDVYFSFSTYSSGYPSIGTYQGPFTSSPETTSTQPLTTLNWTHLAATLNQSTLRIFINGLQTASGFTIHPPNNVTRVYNYLGKSNWAADSPTNARLGMIRIYNRALNQTEIIKDMNT